MAPQMGFTHHTSGYSAIGPRLRRDETALPLDDTLRRAGTAKPFVASAALRGPGDGWANSGNETAPLPDVVATAAGSWA